MLKIRMQRTGRTNAPSFRIVVMERSRGPRAGNFLEKLGTYNPKTKERNLNAERAKHWLSVGAKASGTVHNMLVSAGIIEGKKVNVLSRKSPPKVESEQKTGNSEQQSTKEETPASEPEEGQKEAAETVAEAVGEKKD